jgi:hypothetical protein
MSPDPHPDPVLSEIRRVRDRLAEEHHYDVASFFRALRAHQAASGRQAVTYPPRRIEPESGASESAA